jgi:hypothetical protein
MTTTVVLANMPASATDVAVKVLDQTKIRRVKLAVSDNGRTILADYVYKNGDPTTPTTIRIQQTVDPVKNLIRSSITLSTTQVVLVDDVETERAEVFATLTFVTPGRMEDAGDVLDMIGTLYSLAFNGVTSKVPNTGVIDSLNFGILDDIYS